jgi:magnesium chelatase family protein
MALSCWSHPKWNPHPCGSCGNSWDIAVCQCRCVFRLIENYRQRISGPLLDRIDLHAEVPLVNFRELTSKTNTGESSETIRQRVIAARQIQSERFRKSSRSTYSSMGFLRW